MTKQWKSGAPGCYWAVYMPIKGKMYEIGSSISQWKDSSISSVVDIWRKTWKQLYREGYRCKKVIVTPVDEGEK